MKLERCLCRGPVPNLNTLGAMELVSGTTAPHVLRSHCALLQHFKTNWQSLKFRTDVTSEENEPPPTKTPISVRALS